MDGSTASIRRPEVPVLSFLGATGTVTGSRFLIDAPRARVLVDAGMFQGQRELRERNWNPFPVDPATIDAAVLTHAHIDHVGYLPVLVRDGFGGVAHATSGTVDLAGIVLPDSGHLQEEEANYRNRKGFSKHQPALPLYTEADAISALDSLRSEAFDREVEVAPGVHVTFRRAGHILGSATLRVRLEDADDRVVAFSGDLGRPAHPLLVPPDPLGDVDVVVMESTYGDREHDDTGALDRFAEVIRKTAGRGGTVLIPAFAVDRTEVVLFHLAQLVASGQIPRLPIYVDSPMALSALAVYRKAIAAADPEIEPSVVAAHDVFDAGNVTEIRAVEDSIALADVHVPSIIVSASGMASGGRVVHHLERLLPDHRNSVLLVGFQAPGTRGRLLADGIDRVKILGRYLHVRAEVVDLGAFSVHAGRDELVAWLHTASAEPDVTYLVHGEPDASLGLADRIARSGWDAVIPRLGERVRLD